MLPDSKKLSTRDALKEYLAAKGKNIPIECEVRTLEDIKEVFAAGGVDRIMFDNFSVEQTREAVALVAGRCELKGTAQYEQTKREFSSSMCFYRGGVPKLDGSCDCTNAGDKFAECIKLNEKVF